ncbi:hypothetical protein [Citricoccus sp. NR2]|uniref:hypothetical protein n=1 Tax=Citricoccus sp. NR2 TaxID=3004095 RepID=UPI0022DDE62A|nr:hypothetical protein [Citricoccus sp. NR2]WBL19777.1 hypothetical protein O1A05_03535 [Citricoccus sp. NR2]
MTEEIAKAAQASEVAQYYCPPELFDSWKVHVSAIRRNLHTWMLPGSVLLAGRSEESLGELAFAHGVPQDSRLSSVTMVQDKRVRRAILEANRISVPKGATFSIGRGAMGARRFASELNYPVVVKPMVGDNFIETRTGVQGQKQLNAAISYLETAPPFREDYTASSYAFTAIQTPKDDGSRKTRDNYRYLVEKHVHGEYLRLLGIRGTIASAIYTPNGAWGTEGLDVTDSLDASFHDLFESVCEVFPGLPLIAVDVVASMGHSAPVTEQQVPVVEVSERPWLVLQNEIAPASVEGLADGILSQSASDHGIELEPAGPTLVSRAVRWEGVPHYTRFLEAVKSFADEHELTGWVKTQDEVGGVADGLLQGSASSIALLGELALDGRLGLDPVISMDGSPVQNSNFHDFSIL